MWRTEIERLKPGDVIGRTIHNERGDILLRKGTVVNSRYIENLSQKGYSRVWVQDEDTADIIVEQIISDRLRSEASRFMHDFAESMNKAAERIGASAKLADLSSAVKSDEFGKIVAGEIEIRELNEIVDNITEEVFDTRVLFGLETVRSHDNHTFLHSIDVTAVAVVLGRRVLRSPEGIRQLAVGSILHDCGKVFIERDLLNKPGKLTAEEFESMKQHPQLGYQVMRSLQEHAVLANHVAYQHHERQDGKGYPRGLRGLNTVVRASRDRRRVPGRIILVAEIASVANVYDALSSDQPYRKGLPTEKVVDTLQEMAGPALNSKLVELFLALVPLFPVGAEVTVSNGDWAGYRGIVTKVPTTELNRPVVRLLHNNKRDRIKPFELDLAAEQDVRIASVQ